MPTEMFTTQLNQELDKLHLLKHPFYQAWSAGELSLDDLRTYACQYYHHVNAFPRYISATHSNCDSLEQRQVLLENLMEEEHGDGNHPNLWLEFAEGLGLARDDVINCKPNQATAKLIKRFLDCGRQSYAAGLGALYTYERQVPDTAKSKIEGLAKFYNIDDERTTKFFDVHLTADKEHSQDAANLLEQLSPSEQAEAKTAALGIANELWDFLSGIQHETANNCDSATV